MILTTCSIPSPSIPSYSPSYSPSLLFIAYGIVRSDAALDPTKPFSYAVYHGKFGALQHGEGSKKGNTHVRKNDLVEIELDADNHSLVYFVNNKVQKLALEKLPPSVKFMVCVVYTDLFLL